MKYLFIKFLQPGVNSSAVSVGLLLLRLSVGFLMLTHGYGKFMMLFGSDPIQFPDPIGLGTNLSFGLVVFAEFVCSILLILGLGTRFAALTLLINMLVAALVVHGNDPFAVKELAVIYAAIYGSLLFTGGGSISADAMVVKRCKSK
jgi:putative oxidoreductase